MSINLSAAIRQHVDTTAPPLTLDDIVSKHERTRVSATPERTDRRPRAGLGLAAAGLVAVGSVAVYATVTRPDSNQEVSIATVASDPAWYSALAPALPDGFRSIAIYASNEQYVGFESFDLVDGRSLQFIVSRVAMEPDPGGAITLEEALAIPAGSPLDDDELDISLPDGRQVGVACVINAALCPEEGSAKITRTELRDFALHLATAVRPEDLPPATSTLDHVALTRIRAVAEGVTGLLEVAQLEAPHYAMSFVQYAREPLGEGDVDPQLVVRTLTGLYPTPPASETISRTDTPAGTTQWIVTAEGVLWSVTDTTRHDPAIGQRVLTAVSTTKP